MLTGVEIVGLVLGVLPLVIEAGKAYSEGVDSLLDIAVKDRYDENLEEFYVDFYLEIVYLDEKIKEIARAVAAGYAGVSQAPSSLEVFSECQEDPELEKCLQRYFGSDARCKEFTLISRRVLKLLNLLIGNKSTNITASDRNERSMFTKLTQLISSRKTKTTSSTLLQRFGFFQQKNKRDQCIERLKDWNERLTHLMKRADGARTGLLPLPTSQKAKKMSSDAPSIQARNSIARLHQLLCRHQNCSCAEEHEIRLCLGQIQSCVSADSSVCIDFLISHQTRWQEGNVTVTSVPTTTPNSNTKVLQICHALAHQLPGFSVQILVEDTNGQHTLWQSQPRPRRMRFVETSSPMTLRELLTGSVKLSMKEKRQLALVFAYSLLLYHDSAWLSHGWMKEDIVFFLKNEDEPDLERPFLSSKISGNVPAQTPARPAVFHRNPDIMALGILLVEIFNERPIEAWRTRKEEISLNANTNWLVADRVAGKMDDSPFQAAIVACLKMDWVSQMKSAHLGEDDVRLGMVTHVIAPLQQDFEWLI